MRKQQLFAVKILVYKEHQLWCFKQLNLSTKYKKLDVGIWYQFCGFGHQNCWLELYQIDPRARRNPLRSLHIPSGGFQESREYFIDHWIAIAGDTNQYLNHNANKSS